MLLLKLKYKFVLSLIILSLIMLTTKREAEGSGGSAAKRGPGAGGYAKGSQGVPEEKKDPIPRQLTPSTIYLHFTQRSWEELGPGELKYLPLCMSPKFMFDQAMRNQFEKFKPIMHSFKIHHPKARISNILLLQDDLTTASGTPIESSIYTQAAYMMSFTPTRITESFALGNRNPCSTKYDKILALDFSQYDAQRCDKKGTQLYTLSNFTDFEQLCIYPKRINVYAGWNRDINSFSSTDPKTIGSLSCDYISPQRYSPFNALHKYSANLYTGVVPGIDIVKDDESITWAKNLDKLTLHKFNDSFELNIETNLDNLPLMNVKENDIFQKEIQMTTKIGETEYKLTYPTLFGWPGNNRPYFNRADCYEVSNLADFNKKQRKIPHHFFCMPPIKKPDGSLLKQRASFQLEQSMSIEIQVTEAIFQDTIEEDAQFVHQTDGIIIRPFIFGDQEDTSSTACYFPAPEGSTSKGPASNTIDSYQDIKNIYDACPSEPTNCNKDTEAFSTMDNVALSINVGTMKQMQNISTGNVYFKWNYWEGGDIAGQKCLTSNMLITAMNKLGYKCKQKPNYAPVAKFPPASEVFYV